MQEEVAKGSRHARRRRLHHRGYARAWREQDVVGPRLPRAAAPAPVMRARARDGNGLGLVRVEQNPPTIALAGAIANLHPNPSGFGSPTRFSECTLF